MSIRRILGLLSTAVPLALACVPQSVPQSGSGEEKFERLGAVQVGLGGGEGSSASFDESRVVGPNINVSRRADGSWAGTLHGQPVNVSKDGLHINGAGMSFRVKQSQDKVTVGGLTGMNNVRIAFDHERLDVKTLEHAFSLPRTSRTGFGDDQVRLSGQAAQPDAPQPQLALALLASL